jgi:predicted permease
MLDVINLALPFFGLIFIGFGCGRIKQIPDTALAWMDFFIVYVALPALFYRILAKTPLEQLAQVDFMFATTLATFWAFSISFAIGMTIRKGNIAESTIAGLAGGYGNIGYMGPGLALRPLKSMPWEVPPLAAVKLMVHPVLVFLLLSLFGPFDQVWVYTAVLMAALPPALNVFVFARQYDAWVEQASSAVLNDTLVPVVTLTSVMWMVKSGSLPALLFR